MYSEVICSYALNLISGACVCVCSDVVVCFYFL